MQISKLRLAVAGAITAASFSVFGAGAAFAVQSHMNTAKDLLNKSLTELEMPAQGDSGGHREQAIEMVHMAIDEVTAGIDYAALHR